MLLTADGRDTRSLRWDEPAPFGLDEVEGPSPGLRRWVGPLSGRRNKHTTMVIVASVDSGASHVSVSCTDRYPTWDEIKAVREWGFRDDVEVVMVLPPKEYYVNIHANCFHLWESAYQREGRVTERPINLRTSEVRAVLAGTKTQARRIVRWPTWADPERDWPELVKSGGLALYVDGRPRRRMTCQHGAVGDHG